MKHHEDCDQFQAEQEADGPYGNPYIEPTDYACYCPTPEPKRVTITIDSPDEDGDYQVRVKTEGGHWLSYYSQELAEILPDSREVKHLLGEGD